MDEKKKLYDTLVAKGLYTKSYEDFIAKYSNKESVDNMYKVVSDRGLYTKDQESFNTKYFSDLKKKEETVSPEPVQEPSQISTESVQEPIESPLISSESKPSQPEASTTEDTPQVIGTQPNANGFFELSNTGVEGNYSDKTAAGTGYDPSYSTGGSDMLADIYSQPSSPMLFSPSEQEVAMDVFKKSVHRYADPEGPVNEIGGYKYKMQMKQMIRMRPPGKSVQDPERVDAIISYLETLHKDAINKNSRNAREVSQKQKENLSIKDFGKEASARIKSTASSSFWAKETFSFDETENKGLDQLIRHQLVNNQFEWVNGGLRGGYKVSDIEGKDRLKILNNAYKNGEITLKNPLKEEKYQGYLTGQLSAGAKEYAYTKDMQDIKFEERSIGDFSDESAGAFGGESFDVQASRRKKAITAVNSGMDFAFIDRYMTDHEVTIYDWINKLNDLNKKVKSEDISEGEKSRLEKEIALASKRIKDARDNGADLLFDPVTGESVVPSEASQEAINLQKEIDLKSVRLTGNTKTDLQNMRRDLYWRFQYLDAQITNNYDEVVADAPMFGQLLMNERRHIEKALPLFGGTPLLDEYKETYEEMIAVNRALMLNEDPGTIERSLSGTFAEGLREATVTDRDYSTDDIIEGFGSAMNEYGVELSQTQKSRIKDSFGEEVMKGMAATIPEVGKFIAISVATEGLGIGAAIESSFAAMKLATNSKAAKAVLTFLEPTLKMEAQFQLAGQDAGTGTGEAIGQMGYDALGIDKLLNSLPFTKKWKAIVNTVLKTAAGATGETVQEYTGEMLNRLVEGEEFGDALLNTIGDDPARKALVTYLISSTMSLGTMGSNYRKAMTIMEDNLLSQVSSDPEVVAAQNKIIEERGKELKEAKSIVEGGTEELDRINKQIQDLQGIKGKLYGDFSGGAKEEGDVISTKETEGELSNYTVDGKVRSDNQIIENLSDPKFIEKVKSGEASLNIQNPSPEVKTALEGSGLYDTKVKQDVKEETTPETKVDETPVEGEQQVTEGVESDAKPTEKKTGKQPKYMDIASEVNPAYREYDKKEKIVDDLQEQVNKAPRLSKQKKDLKAKLKDAQKVSAQAKDKLVEAQEAQETKEAAVRAKSPKVNKAYKKKAAARDKQDKAWGDWFQLKDGPKKEVAKAKYDKAYGEYWDAHSEYTEAFDEAQEGKQQVTEGVEVPQLKDREVSELENRMTEIENSKDPADKKEFNDIENELQSREWKTILDAPMDKLNEVLDDLAKKDKEMPNGFGTFIDPESIREIKEIAEKYSPENTSELTDQQVEKDFQLALNETGDNLEEASSFRMREALKEASKRGITIESLIETAVNKYVNDGFDKKTGEEVVASKLEKYLNKTKQDEQTRSTDGTVLDKKESQQSAETKKPKFQKSKETQEDLQQGKDEAKLLKEGKTTTTKPVKIFKGLGGKKDLSGARINAHEGAEGVFSSIDESEAADYGREEGVSESVLPEGTTIEVVEVDGTGMTTSQYRKAEVEAINNSDAQVVKLVTVDGVMKKGARKQEQYVIKDPKLIEDVKKTKKQVSSDRTDGETTEGTSTDQEAGGKKTGKERLKAAVKEYSERQKKESEDFRAKAEAKPKAPRDARKVFKKQNAGEVDNLTKKAKTEGKKKALGTIKNIIKALGSINPDIEVVVHETEQSYLEEMGKEAKGTSGVLATDGKIHLNLSKIKDNTALHEAAHVVMAAHMKANPEAITEFKGQLEGILPKSDVDSLTDFASEYESDGKQTVDEEFVIEALSRIANGSIVLTKTRLDKLKALLRNLAKKLGMTPSQIKLTGKEDVVRFSEKLTEAFSEGREITTESYKVEGNKVKFQKTKKESKLFREPNKDVIKVSEKYKKDNNIDTPAAEKIYELDLDNSKDIADEYENLTDAPNDPKVKKAYTALANEVTSQFNALTDSGFEVEVYEGKGEPYASSQEMLDDLKENKRLLILSTESDFGDGDLISKDNPMLQDSGLKDVNGKPLLVNDLFRFVHDVFGHGEQGTSFGAIGEENAWNVHSKLFSDDARRALTTETRGQNSWVNFGPHMRNPDGSIKKKGDPGYLPASKRPFAKQKNGLLPDSVVFPERVKAEKKVEVEAEVDVIETSPELKKVYEDIDRILGRKPGTTKTASKRSLNVNINKLKRKADAIRKQAETDKKSLENVVEELGRPISVAEAQALIKAGKTPKKSIPQLIEEKKANIRRLAGQLGSTTNMGVGPNGFKLIGELISLAKLQIIQGGSTFKAFLKSLPFPLSKTVRKIWNAARLGLNSNYKSKRVTFGVKNLNTRQAQNYYLESKDHMEPVTSVDNLLSQLDEIISINQIRIDSTLDAYKKRQLEKANAELIKEYNAVRLKRAKKGASDADVLAGLQIKLDDKFEAVTEDSKMSFEYESLSFWETVIKAGIVDSQYAQKRVQKLIKDQTGEGVSASKDPYILNDLQRGKVQRKIEKIMNYVTGERFGHVSLSAVGIAAKSTKKDSLIGRMKSKDISRNELGRFMLFRHVKERNKRMETLRKQARDEAFKTELEKSESDIAQLELRFKKQEISEKDLKKELKIAAQDLKNENIKIEEELPILTDGEGGPGAYCGITNKKAQEYLDKIDPVKKENMTEFAKEYKENILDKTVDIYLEAGLINKENADALKNGTDSKTGDKFDFYVPMKVNGDIINDIIEASGVTSESSKRNIDGLSSLQAASKSNKFKAFDRINPFDQGLYDMQYAVVKAEQNETRKALLDMVQKNRNRDLWEVYRKYPPGYTLKKGDIPRVPFGDNEITPSKLVTVKKDGKTFLIHIKDVDLRNSWVDDAGKSARLRAAAGIYNVLNKISGRYMNFKRSILTTLNPSFAIPNLTRDVQDALFNLTGLDEKGLQGEFLKSIPGAMKGFAQNKRGKKDKKWAKIYQEMVDYGGEISWMHLGDVSETINDINERLNKGWWSKTKRVSGATSILDGIELFNSTLEQGTRVAIYKAVSDRKIMNIKKSVKKWKNLSKQELENISEAEVKKIAPEAFNDAKTEAAAAAKNVTINFNRKGHLGGIINSVWMFSNAGFQGASTGLNTLTTKRGKRFAGKIMIFGAAYRAMLASLTDDEDWQKIESRYDLENNFVLPIDLSTGECITIPKSYGPMRALINIGGYLFDSGVKTYNGKFGAGVSELIFRTANEAHKIMDPISGSSDNVLSSFTPEVVKPIIENWTNKNYRGKRIVPNRYHKPDGSVGYLNESQEMDKPDRLKYYDDIAPAFITMAGYADNLGLDFSPEEMEHLFEGYVYAGVVKDLGDMSKDIYSGEFETSNLGIIRRFYKNPTEEQRTWRKRAKVDELTILSNDEIFDEKQISLLKSLLTDLYPIEAQGIYGKLANKNRAARKREWRSIQENQERLKDEEKEQKQ